MDSVIVFCFYKSFLLIKIEISLFIVHITELILFPWHYSRYLNCCDVTMKNYIDTTASYILLLIWNEFRYYHNVAWDRNYSSPHYKNYHITNNWKRYLDECFIIWSKSMDELFDLKTILNNINNNLQFTPWNTAINISLFLTFSLKYLMITSKHIFLQTHRHQKILIISPMLF